MTQILKEWADWYVSCAGGDIPPEAQAAYDAIDEIEALRAANNSLRDYFAGQALAGYFANAHTPHQNATDCAAYIYEMVDAMLKEARNVR